jgi:hypothetical protein
MKPFLSLLLAVTLALPGCATARASHNRLPAANGGQGVADPQVMADYIRQLPVGSRVRLSRTDGDEIRGLLIKNDGDPVVVQRRARVPEAPIEVPLRNVIAVEIETPGTGNLARNVAVGAAAAAGTTLVVLMILAAVFSD